VTLKAVLIVHSKNYFMAELVGMSLGLSQLKIIGCVFYKFQRKHNAQLFIDVRYIIKMIIEWER